MKNIPIGEHLIEKGLITAEDLQRVLAAQKDEKNKGKKMGDLLQEMGLVTENQFSEVLAERLNITFVDVDNFELIPDIVKKIPEDKARKYNCIALNKIGRRLTVATDNPSDFYAMEDLRGITGCSITFQMGIIAGTSLTLVSIVMTIFMDFLELLVSFIQAYVFTMLSAVFIGLAHLEPENK